MTRAWMTLAVMLCGCGWDFERMIDQPYREAYEASPVFDDGMAMQAPPAGTVARDEALGPPELLTGQRNGADVAEIPLPVDLALLERGRGRYQIFCAPCHGMRGDSRSQVSENMLLRAPPVLVNAPVRDYPPGRVYRAIHQGYGLMRSYASQLDVRDRWAVVAYIQALQLSQRVALDTLPERLRKEAEPWL